MVKIQQWNEYWGSFVAGALINNETAIKTNEKLYELSEPAKNIGPFIT